jgi:hypothetical protein
LAAASAANVRVREEEEGGKVAEDSDAAATRGRSAAMGAAPHA